MMKDIPIEPIERITYFPKTQERVRILPKKENLWIFLMAGQSNMAGRGRVMPEDTIPHPRVIVLTDELQWMLAKEPLHLYEPTRTGLDCGLSFGKKMTALLADSIHIALIPTAVGGSAVEQWLGDSLFRKVRLLTNFEEKLKYAQRFGLIKGILWNQGGRNAKRGDMNMYKTNLEDLFDEFRILVDNKSLPIFISKITNYDPETPIGKKRDRINQIIQKVANDDPFIFQLETKQLETKSDRLHLNAQSQRLLGELFAETYMKL